jgi:hypothetical protein
MRASPRELHKLCLPSHDLSCVGDSVRLIGEGNMINWKVALAGVVLVIAILVAMVYSGMFMYGD